MTKLLTRTELARGRKLVEAAFTGPWRYNQWNIECPACEGGTTSTTDDGSCTHPACDGTEVPATFVEAPQQYPEDEKRPQIVAMIEVPGIDTLAEANGECICWLRNNAAELIAAKDQLELMTSALTWLYCHEARAPISQLDTVGSVFAYAESLGWKRDSDA